MWTTTLLFLAFSSCILGRPTLDARDQTAAVVNFGNNTGTPKHLASGILYGVPDTPNQIPSSLYTGMGFNYLRAGGAQIGAPGRGWIYGLNEYKNRFASVLSNYKTARQYNAPFVFLASDLWGADTTQNSSAPYPGDNGSFAYYDAYLNQVISDIKANGMTAGFIWDIWNEPDLGTVFWGRSQAQYLQMWGHTYYKLKAAFGTTIKTSGPSSSGSPYLYDWFNNFASYVAKNGSIPDQWSWHMEQGGQTTMSQTYGGLQTVLKTYNLPQRPVNINEYAIPSEQNPAGSAWFISQLERVNAIGLRGNWLSTGQLHDFLASLLSKPGAPNTYSNTGTGYFPNGEYQVYKYYNQNMTGYRVGTSPSPDFALDLYATVDKTAKKARVLAGIRQQQGVWVVTLNNLTSLGLPASGNINIQTYGFSESSEWTEVDAPNDLGTAIHPYSGNTVSFGISQTDDTTAYAFEFALP